MASLDHGLLTALASRRAACTSGSEAPIFAIVLLDLVAVLAVVVVDDDVHDYENPAQNVRHSAKVNLERNDGRMYYSVAASATVSIAIADRAAP